MYVSSGFTGLLNQFDFKLFLLGLMELSLTGSGNNLLIESNGLHVKSKLNKTLYLSGNFLDLGANAFGNVDGGELWNHLYLETSDFPEEVFRLFLKSHFDKNSMGIQVTYFFFLQEKFNFGPKHLIFQHF